MRIVLANPRGFCAGVSRAIEVVRQVLDVLGPPIYVRHEIVHNRHVVAELAARGAVFVDELDEVPDGATVIFSAHGVSQAIYGQAKARALRVFDATCPLVTKVHLEVAAHALAGRAVIVIGHRGHAEVEGTVGHYDTHRGDGVFVVQTEADAEMVDVPRPDQVAFVTQTTLSIDDTARIIAILRRRFPAIRAPNTSDICYATENRQLAVQALASLSDVVLVVGAPHSSNSLRLREMAAGAGVASYLIEDATQIKREWLCDKEVVGITASASAPEALVRAVVAQIKVWWPQAQEQLIGEPEGIVFRLPRNVERLTAVPAASEGRVLQPVSTS